MLHRTLSNAAAFRLTLLVVASPVAAQPPEGHRTTIDSALDATVAEYVRAYVIANVEDLLTFGRAMREPGLLSEESLAAVWTRPTVEGVESPMSFGWFPRENPSRIGISGSNAGVQAGLTVWQEEDLVVAVLANSWGRGSRSGEFMNDGPSGFVGRLAAVCGVH